MPILPPYQHRDAAESFGSDAERYDRARPGYPPEMVAAIVAGSPGPEFLDVGIGTGIAAGQFRAAGCRVLGVDVDDRMAAVARRRGFEVEVAKFEEWDPAGRQFDAIVAGQTWHWVEPVAGAAKAAEALRAGGRIALFWNAGQPAAAANDAFAEIYGRVLPDLPVFPRGMDAAKGYSVLAETAAKALRENGSLSEPAESTFPWTRRYTRDEWLDQVPTTGIFGRLTGGQQRELLTGLGAAVDSLGGAFTMRYTTVLLSAVRTGH